MARFLHHVFSFLRRKGATVILALFFFLGLICGIQLFRQAEISASLMRGAFNSAVSIVQLLSVILLPFLFSAFAVYFSKPKLLYGIAFLKACAFSFVSAGIYLAFGSAGWLVRWLLMFSDCCTLPLLWLYWMRNVSGSRVFSLRELGGVMIAACLIGCLDHYFIVPFLTVV